MLLPWEYGVRNLARRPLRTSLTLLALATVILLVLVVVGFIRGLEKSLAISGDPDVMLVYSVNSEENIENSAIPARTPSLLAASVSGTERRYGTPHVSPEMYLGTRMTQESGQEGLGLVRGTTTATPLVRRGVKLVSGHWPGPQEVIVGKLAAAKLGFESDDLAVGRHVQMEGQSWTVVGTFEAGGAAFESEVWCRLEDLQTVTRRQDLTLVAMLLESQGSQAEVELFCKERIDLELRGLNEVAYYRTLQQHYQPVRILGWVVVALVSGAGVFAGLNMMYGAVVSRIREIATLQAMGYRRRAILISLIQEGVLLAAAAALLAGAVSLIWLNGQAIRFTMGAFALQIDSIAILIGCAVGMMLGVLGALPPAIKALRASVAVSLKSV